MNDMTQLNKAIGEEPMKMLADLGAAIGMVPNLPRDLATSPETLRAFMALNASFQSTEFSENEQQVILIAASAVNHSPYCVAAHSTFAEASGTPREIVHALRNGIPIKDPKLEALHRFTRQMVLARGVISAVELNNFYAAGYQQSQAVEVVLGITIKTLTNYASNMLRTPVDDQFTDAAWERPLALAS